ncbi:hypothetical protein NHQ30_011441 [Ciborinia camelliae]|nr:hypothetical protein NHQ30_011441 [Ciborinia camelliae]
MNFDPDNECLFLKKLPVEIRLKIYECLLVNDILGTAQSVSRSSSYGAELEYELSPQILRLCRKIHDEALPILYEKNTFYIACVRVDNYPMMQPTYGDEDENSVELIIHGPQLELCPLTRYHNSLTTRPFPKPNLDNYTSVRKVRHWRVVVSRLTIGGDWNPIWSLVDFCRSICANPPTSLELLILPCGLDYSYEELPTFGWFDQVLDPLRMLRNLQKLLINDACAADVPDIIQLTSIAELEYFKKEDDSVEWELPAGLKTELQTLVTSQQPADLLYMMHKALTDYAQAFERHRPYKIQMGLRREDINDLDIRDPEYFEYVSTGEFNPFIEPTMHPLEFELRLAKDAMASGFLEAFKEHRRNALNFLESQYKKIEEANHVATELIKREKVPGGLFDVVARAIETSMYIRNPLAQDDDDEKKAKINLALVHLEDYAASFNRELTLPIRAQIRSNRRLFESHYSCLTRDRLIEQLLNETDVGNTRHFLSKYRTAFDLCDMQYIEILQARKKLFQFEGSDPKCDLDLKLNRSEEMIRWNVNEPQCTPETDKSYGYGDESDDEP